MAQSVKFRVPRMPWNRRRYKPIRKDYDQFDLGCEDWMCFAADNDDKAS